MTEKRIRQIAVKLWKVFDANAAPVQFEELPPRAQAGWISAARVAVDEVQQIEATQSLQSAKRLIKETSIPSQVRDRINRSKRVPKSCRIDRHGKRVCE